jgi:hypothetical protein
MKTKNIILVSVLSILSVTFTSAADSKSTVYQLPDMQIEGVETLPVVVKNSVPKIPANSVGASLKIEFTVDKKGNTTGVQTQKPLHSIYYPRDRDFAVQMINAVNHWKFEPALDSDGNPVAIKLRMPVKVVEKNGSANILASFESAEK